MRIMQILLTIFAMHYTASVKSMCTDFIIDLKD